MHSDSCYFLPPGITRSFLSGSLQALLMECAKYRTVIINSIINIIGC
ncbi:hypothetical protein yrohd0001_2450 [Yersinia rohdei ATCC 43380]|nr:hypothetical protein yrohd0001_2450 [Yersinia rohdei ATCC 43380]